MARAKILQKHTYDARVEQLLGILSELVQQSSPRLATGRSTASEFLGSSTSIWTMTAQKTTLRLRLRDAFLESISVLPLSWKLWLHQNHPRYLLGVLFRLENEPVTVSPAGPAGARFIMKLSWQGHMAYALGTYETDHVQ